MSNTFRSYFRKIHVIAYSGVISASIMAGVLSLDFGNSAKDTQEPAPPPVSIYDIPNIKEICPALFENEVVDVYNPYNETTPKTYISGSITGGKKQTTWDKFKLFLLKQYLSGMNENDKLIIIIDSEGGSVSTLNYILDAIKKSKGTVHTRASKKAISAASALLASGKNRFIELDTKIILHAIRREVPMIRLNSDGEVIERFSAIRFQEDYHFQSMDHAALRTSNSKLRNIYRTNSKDAIDWRCINTLIKSKQDVLVPPMAALKIRVADYVVRGDATHAFALSKTAEAIKIATANPFKQLDP